MRRSGGSRWAQQRSLSVQSALASPLGHASSVRACAAGVIERAARRHRSTSLWHSALLPRRPAGGSEHGDSKPPILRTAARGRHEGTTALCLSRSSPRGAPPGSPARARTAARRDCEGRARLANPICFVSPIRVVHSRRSSNDLRCAYIGSCLQTKATLKIVKLERRLVLEARAQQPPPPQPRKLMRCSRGCGAPAPVAALNTKPFFRPFHLSSGGGNDDNNVLPTLLKWLRN